jgi:DNA mismatch repair protein MutS2
MNGEKLLTTLEFDKIREMLAARAVSPMGVERLKALKPFPTVELAQSELQRVEQMKRTLERENSIPISGLADIRPYLKVLTVEGAVLEGPALLAIADVLAVSRSLSSFFHHRREDMPALYKLSAELEVFPEIEESIRHAIGPEGQVVDSASPELRQIRRALVFQHERLRSRLMSVLEKWAQRGYCQENLITIKGGRFVIPVKEEFRAQVKGLIADESASGMTAFIEPLETLDIANGIRQLEIDERKEIHRILKNLTAQVAEEREAISRSLEILAMIDSLHARALQARKWNAHAPDLNTKKRLRLVKARHPLLLEREGGEVVPLDLELGKDFRTLVITGPNAGGKTVALKTIGILTLMACSGILMPADPGTEIPFMERIYADIGDEQSIEHDLSSFTSHLTHLKEILEDISSAKMVLIDEIGAATDPALGSALGMAVMERLTDQKALSVITTHHGALKTFAHQHPGVGNGSMEFDEETLTPTYRFQPGIPGSSYAFEIAQRVGIPQDILQRSRELVGEERANVEQLLMDLTRKIRQSEQERMESSLKRSEYAALKKLYEEQSDHLKEQEKSLKRTALTEVEELLKDVNRRIETSIREIKESKANPEVVKRARHTIDAIKQEVAEQVKKTESRTPKSQVMEAPAREIIIGDHVRLEGYDQAGIVVGRQKKKLEVEIGNIKLWADRSKLVLLGEATSKKEDRVKVKIEAGDKGAGGEIDIRGMTTDEALPVVEKYLLDAYTSGWQSVGIIHGKGTGALRAKVTEFLKDHPLVQATRVGSPEEGDYGITIITLAR